MKDITIELHNCYGIGYFRHAFDFSKSKAHAIYAPNGFMKTSFARTMADLSRNDESKDLMFPERRTMRLVQRSASVEVRPEEVLVVRPFVDDYTANQMSTLLVAPELKTAYETAVADVSRLREHFLDALKKSARLKKPFDIEGELASTFGFDELLNGLEKLKQVVDTADIELPDEFDYSTLFGEKPSQFLKDPDVVNRLEAYFDRYAELISRSRILTAQFTHTNARSLQKGLSESHFFDANHWVVLNVDGAAVDVHNASDFRQQVEDELNAVLADEDLRKIFNELDGAISANADLRRLRDFLRKHRDFILWLKDLNSLRRRVWAFYLRRVTLHLDSLIEQYRRSRPVIQGAVESAREHSTEWAEIVQAFNARFNVPFRLSIENQADVILKEQVPLVSFEFCDNDGVRQTEREGLKNVLSEGERRALYLLQIMFELRAKQKSEGTTLLIVDDIADSFDYRNKYAIIEYLGELLASGKFHMIILSHNYDFHRSYAGRLGIRRECRSFAVRNGRDVALVGEKYQKNPLRHWTENLGEPVNFLASIPLVRNIAEYSGNDDVCGVLTNALHLKPRTMQLTLGELDAEFEKILRQYRRPPSPERSTRVWDLLMSEADRAARDAEEHADLEVKIVLSMAIRLKAEAHMFERINDPEIAEGFDINQTHELLKRYKSQFSAMDSGVVVLERVQLMTPENIHLNSFMYEPIIDLGISELTSLYESVKGL